MKQILIVLLLFGIASAQTPKPRKFTTSDTAKCTKLFVGVNKMVNVKFGLGRPQDCSFKLYNYAGKMAAEGHLLKKQKNAWFDFTNRMPGNYFLFVYDKAGKVVLRRKIEYVEIKSVPTIRARR